MYPKVSKDGPLEAFVSIKIYINIILSRQHKLYKGLPGGPYISTTHAILVTSHYFIPPNPIQILKALTYFFLNFEQTLWSVIERISDTYESRIFQYPPGDTLLPDIMSTSIF